MELKDVILSTLAEMEDIKPYTATTPHHLAEPQKLPIVEIVSVTQNTNAVEKVFQQQEQPSSNEMNFLTSIRERLLVLFEGFQAPNNANIEAKIDMTLNFLEYVLVTIDSRIEELERKETLK